jgi:hypothetical protein
LTFGGLKYRDGLAISKDTKRLPTLDRVQDRVKPFNYFAEIQFGHGKSPDDPDHMQMIEAAQIPDKFPSSLKLDFLKLQTSFPPLSTRARKSNSPTGP